MSPEKKFSEFVSSLKYDDLPEGVEDTVTRAFIDTVGVTLAGTNEKAEEIVATSVGGNIESSNALELLGATDEEEPLNAALRVGTASHALDYDDLSWALDGHPSVTLVPALLALASKTNASGEDLITAYAAGFEVECAVAEPISPAHYEAGWHATATFGTFGAAAATAHLLELSTESIERALNITASMPASLKQNFGAMTKPLHAGLCCRSGVTAALLASGGLSSSKTAISGRQGFWDLYHPVDDSYDESERPSISIGDQWAIESEGIHVKSYPCCYFTHTSIAATQELLSKKIDPSDINRIEIRAAGGAGDALTNSDPETELESKFSMEHAVACAVVRDRIGLTEFEADTIEDPKISRIRELVDFQVDESLPYDSHEATVRIITSDQTYERRQVNPPGTHDDPLSEDEFRAKFEACAERALTESGATTLYETLSSLITVENVTEALEVN